MTSPENRVMIEVDAEQVLLLCATIGQLGQASVNLEKLVGRVVDSRDWLFPLAENRLRVAGTPARQELVDAVNDFKPSDETGWRLVTAVAEYLRESDNT